MMQMIVSAATGDVRMEPFDGPVPDPAEALAAWRQSASLSRPEMAFALEDAGILSEGEALDFAGHNIPAPLADMIALLPEASRFRACILMRGARDFPRVDPLWSELAEAPGGPPESEIDALFGWGAT